MNHIVAALIHSASASLAFWFGLTFLLNLVLGKKSQIDAWCETRPRISGLLKLTRGLGLDPWLALQGLSLVIAKKLPTTYASLAKRLAQGLIGTAAALLLLGCTGSFEEARMAGLQTRQASQTTGVTTTQATTTAVNRDDTTCQSLDSRHQWWGGAETVGLVLTGTSGISTITVAEDKKTLMASITLGVLAITSLAKFEDNLATDAWARECSAQ